MELYDKYVGAVLDGRYRIERIIGVGGMAVVFKAFDVLMDRHVAIKLLKEEIAGEEDSVKRFVNESKAVSMMSHKNVVSIYDVNVREDIKYIVMEYIEGITLRNYMTKRGRLTLREIISYTEQILLALNHAHSKGLVHRDIKPQNIMLLKSGIIKVTDFGIAKLPNAETVTMTDKAIGTVYYISPEQASGQPIDRRSDLYSLGVMMYEMATGELPFTAETPVSVAMMQINDTAKAPSEINQDIPKGLEQIIGIAMEKDPQYRYQSGEDMLRHIRRLKENPNIIFKIPKKREPGESRSILSLITGGGPTFPIIAGVALAFFIVLIIGSAFVLGKVTDAMSQTAETIQVDSFKGRVYDAALAEALENSSKYTAKIIYEYSDAHEPGVIMEQSPAAGSSKKVKVELTLTVCSGNRQIEIPSLRDYNYKAAIKELRRLGFEYSVEYMKDNIRSAGQVIATNPPEGETAKLGATVIIVVCDGFKEGDIKVPDFIGMTEKEAFKELVELKLVPGSVTYVQDDEDRGVVISQSLEEDKKVIANTRIGLTVSGGPDYDPENPDGTTEPPETDPPETDPPETDPPETDPPETDPPETDPPETDPPETDPPETDPPETDPPETDPPETDPPETDPPETDPPETDPPETDPPETDPPATEPAPSDTEEVAPESPDAVTDTLEGDAGTVTEAVDTATDPLSDPTEEAVAGISEEETEDTTAEPID